MKRALFVANLDSFHKNFHLPYIYKLHDKGYNVELVSTGNVDFGDIALKHDIVFGRSPLEKQNISAFRSLRKILKQNYYDIIYFSTPVVGAIGRMSLIGTNQGRVIYSAHGYSFYEGNSKLSNWKYILIEKLLCYLTDCVFTMNREDYEAVLRYHFHCKELYNVDGVGVDLTVYSKVSSEEKSLLRKQYQYKEDDFILIYPAEFTERKNQSLLLQTMVELKKKYSNVKLLLLGKGVMEGSYKQQAKNLGLSDCVHFLGYRKDVNQLLKMSDALFASSTNEGLPINLIEGLATGLPIVATRARGHVDLIEDGKNGFLFDLGDPQSASDCIEKLVGDKELYNRMSDAALISAKKYDLSVVVPQYDKVFGI